jgi:hypothetical protein
LKAPNLEKVRNAYCVLLINEKEVDKGIWNIYAFNASSEPRVEMHNYKLITKPSLASCH